MTTDLTCPLCSKVSENKKSHIRHTSYCRKKARRPPRTRKRSCFACIKAKTHCDAALIAPCSRCVQRGIHCAFEQPLAEQHHSDSVKADYVVQLNGKCGNANGHIAQSEPFLANWPDNYASSSSTDDLEPAIPVEANDMTSIAQVTSPSKSWQFADTFLAPTSQNGWLPQSPVLKSWASETMNLLGPQLMLRSARAFTPKGMVWGRSSLICKFIMNTIRAYPGMMLSETTHPPFIHKLCLANKMKSLHRSEPGPLLRCAGIVELWTNKTPRNAHYIWKILRIEQERIWEEVSEYDDMTAANALQAIAIYFLLRVSSQGDQDANFDTPLLNTMVELGARVRGITKKYCDPDSSTRPVWGNWVIVESLRRTIAALFIIEFLFDFSPAIGKACNNSIKLWSEMLLPSSKSLWDATSEEAWNQAYDELGGDKRPLYGELLGHDYLDNARAAMLDRWMAQVDDFGTLVINVASIA